MAEDLIRYDVLVQEALRGVVRKVLTEVAQVGLPGDHHVFISFDTSAPGVRISSRLKQKYAEEMTIVLQHQFWDLNVSEHAFEVGLSFGGVPERLLVPFTALKGFFDPSVQFGLQFEPAPVARAEGEEQPAAPHSPTVQALPVQALPVQALPTAPPAAAETAAESKPAEDAGAAVVSLDAFRKKT